MRKNPIVLILIGAYLPGYKYGGPVRTIANLVEHLGDEFDFWIITRDRDLAETEPYRQIVINQWQQVGKARVFYCSPACCSFNRLIGLIRNTPYNLLYLNSFFDPIFTFQPLLAVFLRLLPRKPIVLAPRGELSSAGLTLKKRRKKMYIFAMFRLGIQNIINWHASSDYECNDIKRLLNVCDKNTHIASDLCLDMSCQSHDESAPVWMSTSQIRVLFLSRIVPMKNLDYALQVLKKVCVNVIFDIYGPLEDMSYWRRCQTLITELPRNIVVNYCGILKPQAVANVYAQYDLFFLPTRGENFGHVIAESLMMGTPVLISDQTPWRGLSDKELGWDISLDEERSFASIIEQCFLLTIEERCAWRQRIVARASMQLGHEGAMEANRLLFEKHVF